MTYYWRGGREQMEEFHIFGALLFIEAMMWILASLLHYFEEKNRPRAEKRLDMPGWLRKFFGDFRREGTLSVSGGIVQGFSYAAILISLIFLLGPGLTKATAIRLWFLQFLLTAITVGLVRDIVPRLCMKK
jgi:hypothetical protein